MLFSFWSKRVNDYKKQIEQYAIMETELKAALKGQQITLKAQESELAFKYEQKEKRLELKIEEIKQLHKLGLEKSINDLKVEHQNALVTAKAKHDEELINAKKELNDETYQKLATELTKLHSEGNSQTKFIQNLALNMMEKAPQGVSKYQLEHIKTTKTES